MEIKKYLHFKRIRQIEIASAIGAQASIVNYYINKWKPLPEKHLEKMAKFLKVSIDEIRSGEIKDERCL